MQPEHFTDLDDQLAVGSYPASPETIQTLAQDHGVTAVLNLQSDEDMRTKGVDWNILWQLYTRAGVTTERVPIIDFAPEDLARHIDAAVETLAELIGRGKKVYVHCNAGINRSPSVVIAYVAAHRGLSVREALAWLSERHTCYPYGEVLSGWAKKRGVPTD